MTTTDVDNWPGDVEGLQGPDLMERMSRHAKRFDTAAAIDQILTVDLQKRPFQLKGEVAEYSCDALIIATGASAKYLGLASEQALRGKGVSACATCDGFFYRDQNVAVIGGGNTAIEEALYLANIARKVTLVHRRDALRGEKILHDKLFKRVAQGKVDIIWNATVAEVLGDAGGVSGIRVADVHSGASQNIPLTGCLYRDWARAQHAAFQRSARYEGRVDQSSKWQLGRLDSHRRTGCFRRRRCDGSNLPPGDHISWHRMHGRA